MHASVSIILLFSVVLHIGKILISLFCSMHVDERDSHKELQ